MRCILSLNPDPRLAGLTLGRNAVIARGSDHYFFEHAHIPDHVAANGREIQDRIADDLSRAVIGDIAAAAGFVKINALLTQHIFAGEQVFAVAIAALCDYVRMLAEQENIFDRIRLAGGDDALLQRIGFGVTNEAEIDGKAVTVTVTSD